MGILSFSSDDNCTSSIPKRFVYGYDKDQSTKYMTVIDKLYFVLPIILFDYSQKISPLFPLNFSKKIILVYKHCYYTQSTHAVVRS